MLSHKAESFSYHSGCGRILPGTAGDEPGQGLPVMRSNQGRILIFLHCTACSEDILEHDIFDVTAYRANELGQEEVSFICPLCGAASTSLRHGRV